MIEELHIRLRPDDLAFHGVEPGLRRRLRPDRPARARSCRRCSTASGASTWWCASTSRTAPTTPSLGRAAARPARTAAARSRCSELADDRRRAPGANQVNRENARRRIVVRCNALGRDLAGVVGDIQQRRRRREVDAAARGTSSSTAASSRASGGRRGSSACWPACRCVGMFVVLYMLYPSARIVLQILNALPTAFIGGVLALVADRPDAHGGQPGRLHLARRHRGPQRHPAGDALLPPDEVRGRGLHASTWSCAAAWNGCRRC